MTQHDSKAQHPSPQQDATSHLGQDQVEVGNGRIRAVAAGDEASSTMHDADSRTSRRNRNEHRASRPSVDYDTPESYRNLDDVNEEAPVQNPDEEPLQRLRSREDRYATEPADGRSAPAAAHAHPELLQRRPSSSRVDYDVPDSYVNAADAASTSPVENRDESTVYEHRSLEEVRSNEQAHQEQERSQRRESTSREHHTPAAAEVEKQANGAELKVSRLATQVYTISYLILFSFLGTLARLGLQAITFYPGTPVLFQSIWPNFAGSLVMGFLAEDRMIFRYEWGTPTYDQEIMKAKQKSSDEENGGTGSPVVVDLAAAKKAHTASKKTIPLYIGLATGFCGSFTSFSSFIRDTFLAVSNDMPDPVQGTATVPRNGGYSFEAFIAVIITTVSISLAGLFIGAHLAITLEPFTPSLPYLFARRVIDRVAVFLAWGCWLGAVLLSILPPDRFSSPGSAEFWRGRATFALVFAPLGCLTRFYASLYLNGKIASFPLGTFAVNTFGTALLAMAWDLAHVPYGGVIGCQVLQGLEDGFCGCLTTVSTWVSELAALRRRHSYYYGGMSVLVSFALMVAIMGGLRWSDGFSGLACTH